LASVGSTLEKSFSSVSTVVMPSLDICLRSAHRTCRPQGFAETTSVSRRSAMPCGAAAAHGLPGFAPAAFRRRAVMPLLSAVGCHAMSPQQGIAGLCLCSISKRLRDRSNAYTRPVPCKHQITPCVCTRGISTDTKHTHARTQARTHTHTQM
jgi:hypothetical protein